jgi:uncharacterized RDD family membrane protein YckC
MKCPKCGYLGFETTDRCRNCQYDFSLAPFAHEPELTLHNTRKTDAPEDFELPAIERQTDTLSSTALDLDRLFGEPDVKLPASARSEPVHAADDTIDDAATEPESDIEPAQVLEPVLITDDDMTSEAAGRERQFSEVEDADASAADEAALPFDDAPIVPPPAARPPLAVRRSTAEVPRNRPRTTRPIRPDTLDLESPSTHDGSVAREAADTVDSLIASPPLGARVGAGAIDLVLLVGIDAAILFLTLKVTGLQSSLEDLRVLPAVPFVGFLALLSFGYVAAFTVAGGQTIGKMLLSLRVIGDDGRPIDAAGGVLRALGCMLVPVTLGLSYLPALFTSDHRAIHDRLAGTRVVQE